MARYSVIHYSVGKRTGASELGGDVPVSGEDYLPRRSKLPDLWGLSRLMHFYLKKLGKLRVWEREPKDPVSDKSRSAAIM